MKRSNESGSHKKKDQRQDFLSKLPTPFTMLAGEDYDKVCTLWKLTVNDNMCGFKVCTVCARMHVHVCAKKYKGRNV